MKIQVVVFWDVTPCGRKPMLWRTLQVLSSGWLHHEDEDSKVSYHIATRHHKPEDHDLNYVEFVSSNYPPINNRTWREFLIASGGTPKLQSLWSYKFQIDIRCCWLTSLSLSLWSFTSDINLVSCAPAIVMKMAHLDTVLKQYVAVYKSNQTLTIDYGLDDRGSILSAIRARSALGPTQPPNQWVPRALSPGVMWSGREDDR